MARFSFLNLLKVGLLLVIFCGKFAFADGQKLQQTQFITNKIVQQGATNNYRIMCTSTLRCSLSMTGQFYSSESFLPIWTSESKPLAVAEAFIEVLDNSYAEGLNPDDYHVTELNLIQEKLESYNLDQNQRASLLADFDVTLSDAFFLYTKHMVYGRVDTQKAYPNWIINKRSLDLNVLLSEVATSQNINGVLNQITPRYAGYTKLKSSLSRYMQIAESGGWNTIPKGDLLKYGSKGKRVELLQQKLQLIGYLDSSEKLKHSFYYGKKTKQAIIEYQKNNGLRPSGVIDSKTLNSLNVDLITRIKQIEINMDRLRWLPLDMGWRYILVNIPDFSLNVYKDNQDILSMPVIVGKEGNRSCVLSSRINYLEINPYWNVPDSIAQNEILPKMKQDPYYAAKDHLRIFTSYSPDANEVDPLKVNWNKIEPTSLTYKFRQEPGPQNSLGRVKFIFPNDCGIYLHDTPTRNLFGRDRRDLSHGCIRVGKPVELADYLLEDKPGWDIDRINAQITSGKRQVVTLVEPIPIHILYATTWVNESGQLEHRNDIYGIDNIDYPVYIPKHN